MTDAISSQCPNCESADTVSYWDIRDNQKTGSLGSVVHIYKTHYPDARKCVDCELVWWTEPQRISIAALRAREPKEPTLMPCPPCPDCGHLHRLSGCASCECTNRSWR